MRGQLDWMSLRPDDELNLIVECSCGQIAGMVALVGIDFCSSRAEAGRFFVDKRYSSRGFAVATMNLLYQLAFLELELVCVTANISASNKGIISWHQHFGMEVVGQGLAREDIRGNGREVVRLELAKRKWETITAPKMIQFLHVAYKRFGATSCLCGSIEEFCHQ